MKKIDIENWHRKGLFELFNSYLNPCFTINVRMDVTGIVELREKLKKEGKDKGFFIPFTYLLMTTLNEFQGFRLRISKGEVYDCGYAKPSFTVALDDEGGFAFCRVDDFSSYDKFAKEARERMNAAIEDGKKGKKRLKNEEGEVDVCYLSAMPWIDVLEIYNPLPLENKETVTVPRLNWGKFVEENGKYKMTLSVTVSHAMLDGFEASQFVIRLQEKLFNPEKYLV